MSVLELFADDVDGRLTAAVVRKGVLDDLYTDGADVSARWGAMYLGRVIKIDTKLEAAFVDLGGGLTGLLPSKHVRHQGADEAQSRSGLPELLSGGQMVIVQVKSEGKAHTENENQKLPRLTMKLLVQGLFLAYSPNSSQVTISRKVENEKILAATAKLKGKGGWIVRHHIERASESEIESEARFLQEEWQKILDAKRAMGDKPGLLKAGPDALIRALTDYGVSSFEHVYVGNKKILKEMTEWCAMHLPEFANSKRLRLFKPEIAGQTLFDIHDVHGAIEELKSGRVEIESGASIIIEPVSALTLIDVNQGSAASIPAANQSAIGALARQCRLRNLSGAIIVDFINMTQKDERTKLLDAVTQAFVNDMGNAQVHGFTRLGLIELTRKRRTATLAEKLGK